MPNWTANTIRALGTPADLRAFLDTVKWEDKVFDFNRVIPMPELLKHTGKGRTKIDGERVEEWYVVKKGDAPTADQVRRLTTAEEALLDEIGYRNWYDWSVDHWGTKWNAAYPEVDDASIASGYVEVSFETAWAAPVPVFRKMFEMFPLISFICSWKHEDGRERYSTEHLANPEDGAPLDAAVLKIRAKTLKGERQ
jgi:hypothetical protein